MQPVWLHPEEALPHTEHYVHLQNMKLNLTSELLACFALKPPQTSRSGLVNRQPSHDETFPPAIKNQKLPLKKSPHMLWISPCFLSVSMRATTSLHEQEGAFASACFAVMRHYSASFGAAIAQQICSNISLITALGFRVCLCVCARAPAHVGN